MIRVRCRDRVTLSGYSSFNLDNPTPAAGPLIFLLPFALFPNLFIGHRG